MVQFLVMFLFYCVAAFSFILLLVYLFMWKMGDKKSIKIKDTILFSNRVS